MEDLYLILNGPNKSYRSMPCILHGFRVYSKKSTVDSEWPKWVSMENKNISIEEFKIHGNCSSRSSYIEYDF